MARVSVVSVSFSVSVSSVRVRVGVRGVRGVRVRVEPIGRCNPSHCCLVLAPNFFHEAPTLLL